MNQYTEQGGGDDIPVIVPSVRYRRIVPQRTNEFQELITLLTQIAGSDAVTASAMLPDRAVPGATREVDICVRAEAAGHEVLIGIECRMSGTRKQTVEWVEAMQGKHSHLPTNKVVLVSSSGFTKNALKLAEFFGMKAITPSEVDPNFVGTIVNNLKSVWVKRFDFEPRNMQITFDPPLSDADTAQAAARGLADLAITLADGTPVFSGEDLRSLILQRIDTSGPQFRDAVDGTSSNFEISGPPPSLEKGGPLYAVLEGASPSLRRIATVRIEGQA